MKEELNLAQAKEIKFYGAHVEAILDSNAEKNRQLLTLSSLVIGLLMGIYDTNDLNGFSSFVIWMIACLCFTICIISTLVFFPKNAEHLQHVINKGEREEVLRGHLKIISVVASISFILGILTLFSLVVYESRFFIRNEPISSATVNVIDEVANDLDKKYIIKKKE